MTPHILLGFDEIEFVDSTTNTILNQHILTVATSGNWVLNVLDENIDLVLLEHHIMDAVGNELFKRIRERGYSCQVALMTETESNFNTSDTPFDACISKPIDDTKLTKTIQRLAKRSELDEALKKHAVLVSEKCKIKQKYSENTLVQNQQFRDLETEIEHLEKRINSLSAELKDKDVFEAITYPSVESELDMHPPDVDV